MKVLSTLLAAGVLAFCTLYAGQAKADAVELTNGDIVRGDVVSLNEKKLTLQSEILGELTIDREKVAAIHLGEYRRPVTQRPAAPAPPQPAEETNEAAEVLRRQGVNPEELQTLAEDLGVQAPTANREDVDKAVEQLRNQGVDPEQMKQLEETVPLLKTPGVSDYFNRSVGGLMSGELDVQDIRKDAINARDQLEDLKKDLGPSAAALNPYLNILNKFIRESDPARGGRTAPQPAEPLVPEEESQQE